MRFLLYLILIILNFLFGINNYPIVLVHGFMGWGENEMGGYSYWGGKNNYVKMLEDKGHKVLEVCVGPVSSNYERAIEMYYQLKGGQVDYGKIHSQKYKIIQKPSEKNYQGLYPEWSQDNPIHIIGHSMGGQTARMLDYLLSQEFFEDKDGLIKEKSELLGSSSKEYIYSITAISTPHNGTTLTEIITKTIPFIQYFIGIAGVVGTDFYNFDLEQWGFKRNLKESWSSYLYRMRNHISWKTKNIASWDLSLSGAEELNSLFQISSDIYYFSIITSTTMKKEKSDFHIPVKGTSIITRTRSKIIGSRNGYWSDGNKTTSEWYENDGVVNSISMKAPISKSNGSDATSKYDPKDLLITGQWYWIKIPRMDHWNIIGHLANKERKETSKSFFISHLNRLSDLPSR
jgi:triacylglycerol lipase